MGLRINQSIVPVLMFHSIGRPVANWVWADMTESVETFEETLHQLSERGYRTVSLEDLFQHMAGQRKLQPKSIVLTFDDGYLDNWVNAVPLLRKYGMQGTVYVTPEFVDPSSVVRPTTDEVASGKARATDLQDVGFMNWSELREADREGVLDVQSHALTHTWHFSGPRVIDFHRPSDIYRFPWLSWNKRPSRKPYYMVENQQEFLRWGHPVFENEKALIVKRFKPDAEAVNSIQEFVASEGGAAFFDQSGWRSALQEKFPEVGGHAEFPGRIEDSHQYRKRVTHELVAAREILEERLGKSVPFLAFPGGGVTPDVTEIARQAGYKSWTLSSWQEKGKRNLPGSDPSSIKRTSGHSKVHWRGRCIAEGGSWWIIHRTLTHQGSPVAKIVGAARKAGWLAGLGNGAMTTTDRKAGHADSGY